MTYSFSLLTWNILAQRYLKSYKWVHPRFLTWDYRRDVIKAIIRKREWDVVCLQEVELNDISTDFRDFEEHYILFHHSVTKKRTNFIGNVTFLRKGVWECKECIRSSSGVHTIIKHCLTGKVLWLSNLHLKAGVRSYANTRISQLNSTLKRWSNHGSMPAVICGDFNDLLVEGGVLRNKLDEHAFTKSNVSVGTCYCPPLFMPFDHIMSHNLKTHIKNMKRDYRPIPNKNIPSDHYPVTCKIILGK